MWTKYSTSSSIHEAEKSKLGSVHLLVAIISVKWGKLRFKKDRERVLKVLGQQSGSDCDAEAAKGIDRVNLKVGNYQATYLIT